MMAYVRSFLAIALSLLTIGCVHQSYSGRPEHLAAPVEAFKSHVRITTLAVDQNGSIQGVGHGCGTVIRTHRQRVYVLTAKHVVDMDAASRMPPGKHLELAVEESRNSDYIREVTVEQVTPDTDIAVISFRKPPYSVFYPARVSLREVAPGDIIWSVGSPARHFRDINHRVVSGLCGRDAQCSEICRNVRCYTTDGPFYPGHSGGGVFTRDGQLVGVVTRLHSSRVAMTWHPFCCIHQYIWSTRRSKKFRPRYLRKQPLYRDIGCLIK
jgi:S1-C subfamily serine protease